MLAGMVLGGGFLWLRTSLPQLEGEVRVAELEHPLTILRDAYAVPHIQADSDLDAYVALGFAHAQDRLWQMEFQRRLAAGRLSEMVGPSTLATDRSLRTLSVYHYAEAAAANLDDETRAVLDAYSVGVNAYIDTHRGALPPEFVLFRHRPEPWRLADSIAWLKMISWNLSRNWYDEVSRALLSTTLTDAQLDALWAAYPDGAPVTVPDTGPDTGAVSERGERMVVGELRAVCRGLEPVLSALTEFAPASSSASNAWVVSGERSTSGAPLLANDPHLGLQVPSVWYLAHLQAPNLDVIGATMPGVPSVLIGHNTRVAWGLTSGGSDVQDLFIERLDDQGRYLTPSGYRPLTIREETIRVRGGDDVTLQVRETRHGPLISDVNDAAASAVGAAVDGFETDGVEGETSSGDGAGEDGAGEDGAGDRYALALAWPSLAETDTSIRASLALNRARNSDEFVAALRDLVLPQLNIFYADTEGNAGVYSVGRIPQRPLGRGLVPVPGWTGAHDWTGFIPFDDLPHHYNPDAGYLVNANNRIAGDRYPYFLGADWSPPYRASRATELLTGRDRHDLASFRRVQGDQRSRMAAEVVAWLGGLEPPPETPENVRRWHSRLTRWNGEMARDAAEPLVFSAWYRDVTRRLYADELGPHFGRVREFRPLFVLRALRGELDGDWCDDVTTTATTEDCATLAWEGLAGALSTLTERYGAESSWRWGDTHPAYHDHPVLTDTPFGRFVDLSIPHGGGPFTLNVGRYRAGADHFRQHHGPSMRLLVDLGDLESATFIQSTGQSGNPLSPHYRDYLARWRAVDAVPMTTDLTTLDAATTDRLRLLPR